MEGTGRSYLTGSIMLSGNVDGSHPEEYKIKSVIGEGGSCVCYDAVCTRSDGRVENGKLKEFYPMEFVPGNRGGYPPMERLSNGLLVPEAGTVRRFERMRREYLDKYKLLKSDKQSEDLMSGVLQGYIQEGDFRFGSMEGENSPGAGEDRMPTLYTWSPGVAGKGFDVYLAEVRKNPGNKPEENLQNILRAIYNLTDCMKAMHTAGLLHLDIKPSNFLLQENSDFKINPDNISLFDINTICSMDEEEIKACGTTGYSAPEAVWGEVDNRTDIYSIGATLFYALVITDDIPDGLYRKEFYKKIPRLLKESALFQASEINSDDRLVEELSKILEKCLAEAPSRRYQSCTDLKADLDKARKRLEKIFWTSDDKAEEGLSEATVVIQKLLYEHPLYEAVSEDAGEINVLVLSSGIYGQKFMDICLQAGQMAGTKLQITAVSDEPEETRAAYLRFRPALSEFVNVNGSLRGNEKMAYANLDFEGIRKNGDERETGKWFGENTRTNEKLIKTLMENAALEGKTYHYVFVELEGEELSKSVARLCYEELYSRYGTACPVCYVSRMAAELVRDSGEKLYPVCVNEPIAEVINERLGEMAFNTHLSWKDTMNIDVTKEREEFFKDKYNRNSSLAFVLSIKYKLHSIRMEGRDLMETAKMFAEQILERRFSDEDARKKFDRMVDLEHRRWVLEHAVEGWTAPRDKDGKLTFTDCVVRGSVKDKEKRLHPCMVHGSETSPLSNPEYTENNHGKWDSGKIDRKLDDLDRMSIELHRYFRDCAEEIKKDEGWSWKAELAAIESLIPGEYENMVKAFKQFEYALENIFCGVESYSRQYGNYEGDFRETLGVLQKETVLKIEKSLAKIKKTYFPIIESNLYRNYKAYDEDLIKKIPFIITYRYKPSMAIVFEDGKYQDGRNEAVFANVAAATVLSPETIHFLYCFNKDSSADLLVRKLDAVLNYFGKRKVHCGIYLAVCCLNEVSDEMCRLLEVKLRELAEKYQKKDGNAWFEEGMLYDVSDYGEATECFIDYLKANPVDLYDGGNRLFPSEFENAMFIGKIRELQIPYFEFDRRTKKFERYMGCEYLRFVEDASFIRIEDMFALMNARDSRHHMPEFADDYQALWEIYTGEYMQARKFENGVGNWNILCFRLAEYENEREPLADIEIKAKTSKGEDLTYFLPAYSSQTLKKLLRNLTEFGIVSSGSRVVNYASDTCKLILKDVNREYKEQFNTMFEDPRVLLPYYELTVRAYKKYNADCVKIQYNDLAVTEVNLDPEWELQENEENRGEKKRERYEFLYDVLEQLQKKNFIRQLKRKDEQPEVVSFVYSSPRIKSLLTCAGKILEIYAYYEVLKTGYFDDIASGYEFCWEDERVTNELDLVLTKGFRSMIVECKAVAKLKLDYYHKLHSIANQFGIGTKKVLLGNTYRTNAEANVVNDMQRSRGSQLSIRTISEEQDVRNIGETLKRIFEEEC